MERKIEGEKEINKAFNAFNQGNLLKHWSTYHWALWPLWSTYALWSQVSWRPLRKNQWNTVTHTLFAPNKNQTFDVRLPPHARSYCISDWNIWLPLTVSTLTTIIIPAVRTALASDPSCHFNTIEYSFFIAPQLETFGVRLYGMMETLLLCHTD